MSGPIVVYGATGFTGGLIARQLRARGAAPVLAGRDRRRVEALAAELGGLEARAAEVHDSAALQQAFEGAAIVVNCAGPFRLLGEPVIRAAVAAGAHYLDTAGEQQFLREAYERCESAARRGGVVVASGVAFEVALGDWAAALAARPLGADLRAPAAPPPGEGEGVDEITVAYAVDHFRPSRGTRASVLESLSRPGWVWREGRWDAAPPAAERRTIGFPPPLGPREAVSFPSGEVITVPRHVQVDRVQTFLAPVGSSPLGRVLTRATSLVGRTLPALFGSPLGAAARARLDLLPAAPTEAERREARFSVVAEARRGFERSRVAVSGADVYGVTAAIVAYACEQLAGGAADGLRGVLAPAEVFEAEAALAELGRRAGLQVEKSF